MFNYWFNIDMWYNIIVKLRVQWINELLIKSNKWGANFKINRGRTAYFGKRVEFNGLKFDSEKEAKFYERFIYGRDLNATVHESFTIQPMVELHNGLRLRSANYTPDVVIRDEYGEAAQLRFKMFAKQYGIPVEIVVPRVHDFRVKVVGLTKKTNPIIKDDVEYKWQDALEEMTKKVD